MEISSGDYCSREAISASRNDDVSNVSWFSFAEKPQDQPSQITEELRKTDPHHLPATAVEQKAQDLRRFWPHPRCCSRDIGLNSGFPRHNSSPRGKKILLPDRPPRRIRDRAAPFDAFLDCPRQLGSESSPGEDQTHQLPGSRDDLPALPAKVNQVAFSPFLVEMRR